MMVEPLTRKELFVTADFGNTAVPHDHNAICINDR